MKAGLVITNEVGFETVNRQEVNRFFWLVNYRHKRGSLFFTSNVAIKDWPEMLAGDEVITAAILDRLLHSCHVLNIRVRSYLLRDLEDHLNRRWRAVCALGLSPGARNGLAQSWQPWRSRPGWWEGDREGHDPGAMDDRHLGGDPQYVFISIFVP
jgi:hypothetical protein